MNPYLIIAIILIIPYLIFLYVLSHTKNEVIFYILYHLLLLCNVLYPFFSVSFINGDGRGFLDALWMFFGLHFIFVSIWIATIDLRKRIAMKLVTFLLPLLLWLNMVVFIFVVQGHMTFNNLKIALVTILPAIIVLIVSVYFSIVKIIKKDKGQF